MITLFNIRPKGLNVGNDAIYIGMQYYLYQAFGQVVNIITLPATSKYENTVRAGFTTKTVYEINQYAHGVIIGGGNIYENGEIDLNMDALNALDVPLLLFSLSRGRVYNRRKELTSRTDALPDNFIRSLNAKASYSLARDIATHRYLSELGCTKAQISGCPTIFLNRTRSWLPKLPEQEEAGILISVRSPDLMSIPLNDKARVPADVRKIISNLRKRGMKNIRILCHDPRDIAFAASFSNIEYIYTGDVYSYLSLLSKCSLNISYRLHSALPCIAYEKPFIKISYDERALSLMETIGLDDWNINMIACDSVVDEVENRIDRLNDLVQIREKARARWDSLDRNMSSTFKRFSDDVITCRNIN